MPTLSGASSGAKQVGKWLESEGFSVKYFLDDLGQHRVRRHEISDAVRNYLEGGTVWQFVVYFSGHGYVANKDEVWLLSDATDDPNEVIGVNGTILNAKTSGLKHIVVISDACRSPAQLFTDQYVSPGSIFPNRANENTEVKVDRFFASRIGQPAHEVVFEESKIYRGLFTEAFMNAYRAPVEELIYSLDDGTRVVSN